jgi:hypothetical protein
MVVALLSNGGITPFPLLHSSKYPSPALFHLFFSPLMCLILSLYILLLTSFACSHLLCAISIPRLFVHLIIVLYLFSPIQSFVFSPIFLTCISFLSSSICLASSILSHLLCLFSPPLCNLDSSIICSCHNPSLKFYLFSPTQSFVSFPIYLTSIIFLTSSICLTSSILSHLLCLFSPPLCYLNSSIICSSRNPSLNFSIF